MASTDPRRKLMFIAAGLSLLFATVMIVLIVRGSGSSNPDPADGDTGAGLFEPLIGGNQAGGTGSTGGSGLFIQITDKNNPDRIAMELRSAQMDPIGPDLYRVDTPRAWVFMKDGSSVSITAAEGTLVLPDRAREPEQGTLTGGVVIRRYPNLGRRADADNDEPEATFKSDTLTFDLTLGEVATPDRVVVTSTMGELAGTDLRMNINEPLERIELFRLQQGEYLRISRSKSAEPEPAIQQPAMAPHDQPSVANADGATLSAPKTAPDPLESFYRAVFKDNVVLLDRGRTIKGDQLDLWARLVDNKLADGALERNSSEPDAPTADPHGNTRSSPSEPVRIASGEDQPSQPSGPPAGSPELPAVDPASDDILLTWTGVAEIRPSTSRPEELAKDEVAARFTASRSGRVLLEDPNAQARGSTGVLDYYATRRHIVMASQGMTGVELVSDGDGLARFGSLELNLDTGIGYAPGAGLVQNDAASGTVTWNEQADLVFEVDRNGITGVLQEAMCSGAVRARRDESTLESDFLRTTFTNGPGGDLRLQRLAARGQVRASDGRNAGGTCEALDVLFDTSTNGDDPVPTDLLARGTAKFNDGPDTIEAEIIDATLKPASPGDGQGGEQDGGARIQRLHTMGATQIVRARDNLLVSGGDVLMHDDRQSVRVQGPNAVAQRDGVRITAVGPDDVIDLDGTGRNGSVAGAGSFSRASTNPDGTTGLLTAAWSQSMTFDDYAGTLHCMGDVQAVHAPDPTRRDAVLGDEVTATFEPYREQDEGEDAPREDREVLTFIARSNGESQTQAAVESARFEVKPGAEPMLARALRLTGPIVSLDQRAGVVDVQGPGSLLVSDQRQQLPPERQALALFSWNESFVHNRNTGQATMIGNVKTHHRRRGDGSVTLIDCDRLDAVLLDPQRGDLNADPTTEAQLRSARAQGNVSMKSGTREALADTVDYNAANASATLMGRPGGYVTIIDTARSGVPIRAGRIFWDLANDRIDIMDAGPFRGSP